MGNLFSDKYFKQCDRVGKTKTKVYTPCNLVLKPLLELLKSNQMYEKESDRGAPPVKTIFSVCSGIGSIFQIFPLTVNQRQETVTLLHSGLVYLLLCFPSKVSTHH